MGGRIISEISNLKFCLPAKHANHAKPAVDGGSRRSHYLLVPPRAVMDTNVLYAGLRSRRGASFQILDTLWQRKWTLVLSQTVLTEYEEILKREAAALGLTFERIHILLDALCNLAERHHLSELWVPVLNDPDDESLVQLAVESKADHLVSHNLQHLEAARKLGVNLLAPKDFLAIIRA